jgi:hypothetical protein
MDATAFGDDDNFAFMDDPDDFSLRTGRLLIAFSLVSLIVLAPEP